MKEVKEQVNNDFPLKDGYDLVDPLVCSKYHWSYLLCLFNGVSIVCFYNKAQNNPVRFTRGAVRETQTLIAKMAQAAPALEQVQCFGRKKTAVAVTYCKRGRGLIKINGCPIELVEPEILRFKAFEPILLLGRHRFAGVDMRIRVKGGGHTSQIYAIRQSIAKALVAYYQKYVDEQSKKEIKDILVRYDRTLLVADPRRCEPKKFGGRGARARFQKSYR
ncbi:hypothetical protein VNO80_12110 [Phaseolus coccineus]